MAQGSRRGAARWPLVALAVVLVGGGIGASVFGGGGGGDEDDEGGSPGPTTEPGRSLGEAMADAPSRREDGPIEPVGRPPEAYEITYLVEGYAPGGVVVDIERRLVRLPFESRVESGPSESPGEVTFLQVAALGVLQSSKDASLTSEPQIAPGSAHVDGDVATSVLEWRHEVRTILDRDCQVVRAGGPIDVATLEPPTSTDFADLCVDADGLVLQEEWFVGGDVFRRRTATELDTSPRIADADVTPTAAIPDGVPGGTFVEVTPDSRAPSVTHWELPSAPEGFSLVGRFAFSPPRADDEMSQLEVPRVAAILDVYADGDGGLVVVSNGGTSDNSELFTSGDDDGDETVDLGGALGVADVLRGLRQTEVRVGLDRGRFLRVYGSLPGDELVALARSLVPNDEPGQVTPLDRPDD